MPFTDTEFVVVGVGSLLVLCCACQSAIMVNHWCARKARLGMLSGSASVGDSRPIRAQIVVDDNVETAVVVEDSNSRLALAPIARAVVVTIPDDVIS